MLQKNNHKKFLFLTIVLSIIVNFSFLEYNNYLIRKSNPDNININAKSLVYGQTVFSVDNEYYLSPVDNYLQGKGWKRGTAVSNGDYFRRVPGYSAVYLFFVKIFGHPAGHLFLKIFQLLLFVSTIPIIFYLCRFISGKPASRLVTLTYALIPLISSWTYYTLTESISPALVIYYFYFLLKAYNSEVQNIKLKNYLFASLFFVFGVLTRPYIALAGLPLIVFTFRDFIRQRPTLWLRNFAVIWMIPLLFIGSWTLRNYLLTHEFVALEKSVHPQTLDRMKPDFRGFWAFAKCWGEDGFVLNTYHIPFFFAAIRGDTSSVYIENIVKAWPPKVVNHFGHDRLFSVLKNYQYAALKTKPYVDSVKAMPDHFLPEQLAVEKEFETLVSEYRKTFFIDYWFKTPLIYLKRMVVNSNTSNIYFFQEENRDKKYVNFYRYLLLAVHLFLYLCLFLNFIIMKGFTKRLLFVYVPLLFVFFFIVVHREIEQRYMLPVLPILIIGSAYVVQKIFQIIAGIIILKPITANK